jgi:hypothetical protein
MVKVLEAVDGHLVIRAPDGSTRLDTRTPMPIALGEDTFSTSFSFPSVPGAGGFAWPANNNSYSTTLASVSGSHSGENADWIICRFRFSSVSPLAGPSSAFTPSYLMFTGGATPYMLSTGGSALLEVGQASGAIPFYWRHMCIKKSGTSWVLDYFHSNRVITGTLAGLYTGTGWLDTTYNIDGVIRWGRFK